MGTTISFTRSGGLAGLDMVASVDLDDVPEETAARVRSALAGLDAAKPVARSRGAGAPAAPPPGADRYQYHVVVKGDGKRRSVTAHDGDLTPELRALVDVLLPFAKPKEQ